MSLIPFPINQFSGLNLAVDPTEIGTDNAVDMLNVETFRSPGRMTTRSGLAALGTGTATYSKLIGGDSTHLLAGRNTGSAFQMDRVTLSSGAVATIGSAWGGASTRLTSTGIAGYFPSGKLVFIGMASRSGATNEPVQWYDGTVLIPATSFSGVPDSSPRYFSVTPWDTRAVEAHFTSAVASPTGANGTTSTLFFSGPGDATTWGANDWLTLAPGGGDEITGMVAWRELLFVIKRQQMFVLYGTNTLSDGSPEFVYRTVDLPARSRATTTGGGENIISAGDGVYLLLSDGLYRTTGGVPVRVSDAVIPVFDGTGPASMLFPTSGDWTIGYAANRVYLTYTVGGAFRTLVYDTVTQAWLLWDLSAGQSVQSTNVIEWFDTNGLPTTYVASGAKIFSLAQSATDDAGTGIPWSYTTGYSNAGGYFRARIISSGERKHHFKTDIEGSGTVTHQVLALNARPGDVADPGGSVTLGTAPAIARGSRRRGVRGTYFAHKLSGSGPAVINGLTYWLANVESDT